MCPINIVNTTEKQNNRIYYSFD